MIVNTSPHAAQRIKASALELRWLRQGADVARNASALALAVGDQELSAAADKVIGTIETLLLKLSETTGKEKHELDN
jgi:hypothetical protein